jgi:hypothetical protein
MPSQKDKNLELAVLVAAMLSEDVRKQITPTDFTGLEREAAMYITDTKNGPREPFVRWLEKSFGVELNNGDKVPDTMLSRLARNVELRHLERTADGKWEAVQRRFYEAVERKRELRKERE